MSKSLRLCVTDAEAELVLQAITEKADALRRQGSEDAAPCGEIAGMIARQIADPENK